MSYINVIINIILDWLNAQTLKSKLAILVASVLIISGVYWYFFWSPNNQELQSVRKTLGNKRSKLNELKKVEASMPEFVAEAERLEKEFYRVSLELPKEEEIPALIESVYSAISAAGLEPKKFVPKKQIKKEIYAEIPIEMSVRGGYFELANFFDRISRLPRIVNVRDLSLKRSKGSKYSDVILDADFITVTFRLLAK